MKKLKIRVDLSSAILKKLTFFFFFENLILLLGFERRSHIDQASYKFIEIHLPLSFEYWD